MTSSMWRLAALAVNAAALANACADEDLKGPNAESPRSFTASAIGANAPRATRVSLTPSTSQAERGAPPVFYRVQVQPGDTVASVAERFRISPEYVIWNNDPSLRDGELVEGTRLDIPSANGILHRSQPGETLTDIAALYGVELEAILGHPANASIPSPSIPPSTVILVPEGRMP